MATLAEWVAHLSAQRGIDLRQGAHIATFLREAGLQEVAVRRVEVPIGRARRGARHIGRMMATNFLAGLEGLRPVVVGQVMATVMEYDATTAAVRAELERYRCIQPFYVANGRRPPAPISPPSWPSRPL